MGQNKISNNHRGCGAIIGPRGHISISRGSAYRILIKGNIPSIITFPVNCQCIRWPLVVQVAMCISAIVGYSHRWFKHINLNTITQGFSRHMPNIVAGPDRSVIRGIVGKIQPSNGNTSIQSNISPGYKITITGCCSKSIFIIGDAA